MEHLPPPPYSETDIYSNVPTSPSVVLTPGTSNAEHLSIPQSRASRASSIDNSIIYTPPDTPSGGSIHQDVEPASSISAVADSYFESRPATVQATSPPTVHSIAISSDTKPEDLPYPEPIEDFLAKDVKPEDWITFVNYLFPDHYSTVNNEVADRKLKAELIDERMHRLTLRQNDVARRDLNQVRAQLEPLRTETLPNSAPQKDVHATIDSWNDGFFLPRGIKIRLVGSELALESGAGDCYGNGEGEQSSIPGSWIPYDHELPGGTPAGSRAPRRGWSFRADSRGFKMGPIEADNSGFRMGNMLIADHKGFRLGNDRFIADHNGLTVGGRSFGRQACHESEDHARKQDVHHQSNKRDCHSRENPCGPGKWRGRHANRGGHQRGRSHSYGRHLKRRGRDSSSSSSSSSSYSSSANSQSSVGSLPEYDDLPDQHLYNARRALLDWLNHPEQPITRQTVQNIKEEFKTAKRISPEKYDQDIKTLRREVKDLMKKFKEKKRTERSFQRELKREKRAAKRVAKRERRNAKREERRGRRNLKGKGKAKEETWNFPPWMKMPASPTMDRRTPPAPHSPDSPGRGFPIARAASTPFFQDPPSGLQQKSYGTDVELGPGGFPASISHSAAAIHFQAMQMDLKAHENEKRAIELRTAATGHDISEPVRVAKTQEATRLEEAADACRREAKRLGAEGMRLDEELARELGGVAEGTQESGVVYYN